MRNVLGVLLLVAFVPTQASNAQSTNDPVARAALQLTPIGALPPLVTSTLQGEVQRSAALALRYGYISASNGGADANNGGVTAIFPVGLVGTISLTAGVFKYTCEHCNAGLMLSLGGDRRLGDLVIGTARDGSRMQFALNGELGYGQPQGGTISGGSVISGAVGIPISFISSSRSRDAMRIVPFVTPGFGFGDFTGEGSSSGSALMLGGGLGIYNRSSSVALSLGFQYIAVQDATVQIGLNLVLGGR
jgi:hypothetical protein